METLSFQEWMAQDISNLSYEKRIDFIGQLFDLSLDNEEPNGIEIGLKWAATIEFDRLENLHKIRLHYYIANGWESKRKFERYEQQSSWDFDQIELSKELFHLRSAIANEDFEDSDPMLQCQIYTNLGNHFSHIGRFIDAQDCWHKALEIFPTFPMALANIGYGLYGYASYLNDEYHQASFIYYAHKYLSQALEYDTEIHYQAYTFFKEILQAITENWKSEFLNGELTSAFDLGKNKKLKDYRIWNIENHLYLNPLNDLGSLEISSHDCLHLPSMTVELDAIPKHHTLFNQIKQEYSTARFLFYESTNLPALSYSDKDVALVETGDYAEYSYNLEKVKIAYRLIYSIFDKIAYLLNDYLGIGLQSNRTSFRSIWHDEKLKALRVRFQNSTNLPLRGLYWVSKDLYDKQDAHALIIEPESKQLADIRNYIEHKSIKITDFGGWGSIEDEFTFCIGRSQFEQKTFKQLKLVRQAIIYTSLAIHHEEKANQKKNVVPMFFPDMPYEDKI